MDEDKEYHEAGIKLFRLGDGVVCIAVEGERRTVGYGDSVIEAIAEALLAKGVKISPQAAWSLPLKEDLPQFGEEPALD